MSTTTKQETVFRQVVAEAWANPAYKQELLNNPVAAIEKLTGEKVDLPEGKQLVVTDQTDAGNVYFNLPAQPSLDEVELTDEQLETVAGGQFVWECFPDFPPCGPFEPIITYPKPSTGPFIPTRG